MEVLVGLTVRAPRPLILPDWRWFPDEEGVVDLWRCALPGVVLFGTLIVLCSGIGSEYCCDTGWRGGGCMDFVLEPRAAVIKRGWSEANVLFSAIAVRRLVLEREGVRDTPEWRRGMLGGSSCSRLLSFIMPVKMPGPTDLRGVLALEGGVAGGI